MIDSERFHLTRSRPVLQKRQAAALIGNAQEKIQSANFVGLLGRLRARIGT